MRGPLSARGASGLSLIEVLVASAILAYCAYIMGTILPTMTSRAQGFNRTNNSYILASTLCDSFIQQPFSQVVTRAPGQSFTPVMPFATDISDYTWGCTVTTENPYLKRVELTIDWGSGNARYQLLKARCQNE